MRSLSLVLVSAFVLSSAACQRDDKKDERKSSEEKSNDSSKLATKAPAKAADSKKVAGDVAPTNVIQSSEFYAEFQPDGENYRLFVHSLEGATAGQPLVFDTTMIMSGDSGQGTYSGEYNGGIVSVQVIMNRNPANNTCSLAIEATGSIELMQVLSGTCPSLKL